MPEENYQKIKLLKIMEILRQETDEEHPMTKVELAARLVAMNVSCSPRSLIRDIKLLNEQGYEIMDRLIGHEKAYFVCDRSFSVPELKILIDAVQAASFVTNKKTGELIDKIAALGGSHRAAILKGNMVKFNARKHRNESLSLLPLLLCTFSVRTLSRERKCTAVPQTETRHKSYLTLPSQW